MSAASKPSDGASGNARRPGKPSWWLGAALLSFITTTLIAFTQEPRADFSSAVMPYSLDWFRYPIEKNAFKRLPAIGGTFKDVFVLPPAKSGRNTLIWAVGNGG
jgi:hypothetical protein